MAVVLDGSGLTIERLVRIARHGEEVELPPGALERIRACRTMLERKIDAREIMYGVNTGIGELCEVILTDEEIKELKRPEMPAIPVGQRTQSFNEVELGFTEAEAMAEAKRCLRCDLEVTEE